MYYIISLKHTQQRDKYITLWRPNNAGYCFSKQSAGFYTEIKEGYHNDQYDSMVITEEQANNLFMKLPYENKLLDMIPNCKAVWESLDLKMTRNGLKRINK